MVREDIRKELWEDEELFEHFKAVLFPGGIKFCNPDFLVSFTEDRARAGKVFDDDSVAFPTEQACEDALAEAKKQKLLAELRTEREKRFEDIDQQKTKIDVWEDLPESEKTAIKVYKQALRDMPATHTTTSQLATPTWPVLEE
jgi:hypothetical protein